MADFCFHFSSVGELEQCLPIIYRLLDREKRLELIYTSHSVQGRVARIVKDYPGRVIGFALPILRFNYFSRNIDSLITAKHLTMVRYDFLPELLIAAKRKSILLSTTLIGKRLGTFQKLFFGFTFSCFDHIVSATADDKITLSEEFGIISLQAELRIDQILKEEVDYLIALEVLVDLPKITSFLVAFGTQDLDFLMDGILKFLNRKMRPYF